ncbi:hypothetical protein MZ16F91_38880 [Escherichia coli]
MAAKAKNGVIGCGPDIPWSAKGEQLLFKALTYNQWLLVGRKTFESMGALPNRKYAVVTRSNDDNVVVFQSIEEAMDRLAEFTGHVIVSGGGEIGTVAKLAMRQPFVLFKGLTFQKLCLPGAFRPGDHHNKMLRPGLCVVHASPQYL